MIDVTIHRITAARLRRHESFDCVQLVVARDEGHATLFLPAGTGQAVADAINAAVAVVPVEPVRAVEAAE